MLLLLFLPCTSTLPASFLGGGGVRGFQDFVGLGTSQLLTLVSECGHKSIICCFVSLPLSMRVKAEPSAVLFHVLLRLPRFSWCFYGVITS